MKRIYIFVILSFSIFLIFSCSQKKNKLSQNSLRGLQTEKKISISSMGGIQFTRSYSETQSMTDEKKINEYIKKQDKSNPYYLESRSDSLLKLSFEKLGIVKGDELLLSKFKYSNKPNTAIKSLKGIEIRFHLQKDTTGNNHDRIIAFYKEDSFQLRPTFHQQIKYAFLDVKPGENEELVVLTEDWLMGTEIYNFEVFEIKTKDQ